jgi:hypothetical protein
MLDWAWWYMPVIPALERQKQKDCKLEAQLGLHSEIQTGLGYWLQNETKKKKLRSMMKV